MNKDDVIFAVIIFGSFFALQAYAQPLEEETYTKDAKDFEVVYVEEDERTGEEEEVDAWVWMTNGHCWARSKHPNAKAPTLMDGMNLFPKIFCTGKYEKKGTQLSEPSTSIYLRT